MGKRAGIVRCVLVTGLSSAAALAQTTGAFPPQADPTTAPAPAPPPPTGDPSPAPAPSAAPVPSAAPAPEQLPPPAAAPTPGSWQERYGHARSRLLAGDFATARQELDELARGAPGPVERALALELAGLARTWEAKSFVFIRKKDLGDASLAARAVGERSTDEIAVLYLNAVIYGLGTGGWLAVQTEPDSAAGFILPTLALGGAAAGGVALLDTSHPLGYGVPQSIVSGMYIGFNEGLVWSLWNQARSDRADEWEGKTVATVIWGSATAGAIVGGTVGTVSGTTPGRASFVGSAALWGGLTAGLAVAAVHEEDDAQDDAALLGAAIGMNAGVVGGMLAAGSVSPTIGRVRFLDLGAIAGGLTAGGLYVSLADENSDGREAVGITSLGIASGLAAAWFLTDGMDKDLGTQKEGDVASTIAPSVYPTRGGLGMGVAGLF